jgi:hypothetical protein
MYSNNSFSLPASTYSLSTILTPRPILPELYWNVFPARSPNKKNELREQKRMIGINSCVSSAKFTVNGKHAKAVIIVNAAKIHIGWISP